MMLLANFVKRMCRVIEKRVCGEILKNVVRCYGKVVEEMRSCFGK